MKHNTFIYSWRIVFVFKKTTFCFILIIVNVSCCNSGHVSENLIASEIAFSNFHYKHPMYNNYWHDCMKVEINVIVVLYIGVYYVPRTNSVIEYISLCWQSHIKCFHAHDTKNVIVDSFYRSRLKAKTALREWLRQLKPQRSSLDIFLRTFVVEPRVKGMHPLPVLGWQVNQQRPLRKTTYSAYERSVVSA